MTKDTLRTRLATDPNFIFSYIYGNNPNAVINNLRGLGFTLNNADDVFNAINALSEEGRDQDIAAAFSVPMLTDQMDPGEIGIVQEVMATSQPQGGKGSFKKLDATSWAAIAAAGVTLIGVLTGKGGVQQTDTSGASGAGKPPEPKKNRTLTIVAIASGVALVIVVLILALRKAK